jgi:hypothetical protein
MFIKHFMLNQKSKSNKYPLKRQLKHPNETPVETHIEIPNLIDFDELILNPIKSEITKQSNENFDDFGEFISSQPQQPYYNPQTQSYYNSYYNQQKK